MEAIRDSFFVQHVVKSTHYRGDQTANVLDLVFTNEQEMIDNIRHEATVGKSHHQTLLFKLKCNTEKKLHDSYRGNFAKGDCDRLRNCVSSQVVVDKINDMNVTQSWKIVKDTIILAIVMYTKSEDLERHMMNNDMIAKIKKSNRHTKGICKLAMAQTICIIPESEIKQKIVAEQQ